MSGRHSSAHRANRLLGHLPGELIARAEAGSTGLVVHVFAHRTIDEPVLVPAVAEPLLVWIAEGSAFLEERTEGEVWRGSDVTPGDLFVVDSDEPYELRWRSRGPEFRAMHVYLGAPLLEAAALAVHGRRQRPRLREQSGCRDLQASALLQAVYSEVIRPGGAEPLLLASTGQAMAVCVLRTFTDGGVSISRRSVLPAVRLRAVVRHMQENLAEPFSLPTLAGMAGLSPFHFSRSFKRSTGSSPQKYFIDLRVAEARRLLMDGNMPVISVAMAVGYTSPSHLAQVFRRLTGRTPTQFRAGLP